MTRRSFVAGSLRHYWRVSAAAALGVGVAVSALAGALLVGESVRLSLRDLALARLGRAEHIVTANHLFTEQLADRLLSAPAAGRAWDDTAPLLALEGVVTHERSGSRAGGVQVYGVDDRFWTFNGVAGVTGPSGRSAFLSAALAREFGVRQGDALLLRVQKPSTIPAGLLQGRRDEPGRGIRLAAARVLDRTQLGDFSPRPQQGAARAIFVPLDRLQRDLELLHRANMLVTRPPAGAAWPGDLARIVAERAELADLDVRVRPLGDSAVALESDAGLLSDATERAGIAAAEDVGAPPLPVLTYIANTIAANGRETPYSLVTALPEHVIGAAPRARGKPVWLTQWAADDLAAKAGDSLRLDYYLWSDEEGLTTASADFIVAAVLPMQGIAIDADLTPEYPGMSAAADMADWDPPFPVDLKRVRRKDEDYWDRYRTAPKAFVRIEDGQSLWRSRYGAVSSLRIPAGSAPALQVAVEYRDALAKRLGAQASEFQVVPVREQALAAAAGTTDFGAYFTYFSFFVVVASLLLTLLFFRLGVEQRAREIGLLAALGYTPRAIRSGLLAEGAAVAVAGAIAGTAGGLGYAWLIMLALRTWWVDAVGTTDLTLHFAAGPLVVGALSGIAAGMVFIAWSLRVVRRASARQLMSGAWVDADWVQPARRLGRASRMRVWSTASASLAAALVVAGAAGWMPPAGAFFASGTMLLVAGLSALAQWLRGTSRHVFVASRWPIARLGLRNARYRPSRSVLSVALVASATFLIVSVGAFRRDAAPASDVHSGTGGYALMAESVTPIMHDPSTAEGREALALGPELEGIQAARFRLRPGDDASCLNLYRPQSPRLLGATDTFIDAGRFSFSSSIAGSPEEGANPWLLLRRQFADGAVPVIGDANSLTYVFHLGVGEDYVMQGPGGRPVKLRIVGALRDSVLQSELIMADAPFTRLFPRNEGFRVFLVAADRERAAGVSNALEQQLQDFGVDVQSTFERLASYHRVENTFLMTFQALGLLGLALGTVGLGTVLLRNVLERRRELALLQATGYRRSHLVRMVTAESVFLLVCGLGLGAACAAIAIAPAYLERGQPFPIVATLGMLAVVLGAGLLSTTVATRTVARMPLLEALKNE